MFKNFFLYVHLFLLKIASHIGVWLGMGIIWMKKPRTINYTKLATIYLNRSDRIGDAIISKPFIRLLIQWLRMNGCEAEIIILASTQNRFLLQDLEDVTNNVRVLEEPKTLTDYESKLWKMIWKHVNFLYRTLAFRWTHGSDRDEQSFFLDMGGGDFPTILRYKELHNPIVAGPNIFWGSHILDIALIHSYVHYFNKNLIESYIEIIEKSFGIDGEFRDFVYDHIEAFYDYNLSTPKSGICLFVGVKKFRNLPVATWRRIIHETAEAFPAEKITVIDDNTNLLYNIFKEETFPHNVTLEQNTYNLTDFTKHIATFAFVAGIDGGGINMVKSLTNSCFINTFAQPNVWSCFTGGYPYHETVGSDNWYSAVALLPPHGQVIAHMHKESFWLPTFNIDGNREMFADFDTRLFINIIRKSLRK